MPSFTTIVDVVGGASQAVQDGLAPLTGHCGPFCNPSSCREMKHRRQASPWGRFLLNRQTTEASTELRLFSALATSQVFISRDKRLSAIIPYRLGLDGPSDGS